MAGSPVHKLDKYCEILLNQDYHVIVVEQISASPNPERAVTKVLSPGTIINENNDIGYDNYLMSIFIEQNKFNYKKILSAGVSIINVSTGKNSIATIQPNYDDISHTDNEIKRPIAYYNPKEILFHF